MEELKNLLILRDIDTNRWEWAGYGTFWREPQRRALQQRHVGFTPLAASTNGNGDGH